MEPSERLLTVRQVAETLSVSEASVRRWLRLGTLGGFRMGSDRAGWRIPQRDLTAFLVRLDQETVNLRESWARRERREARERERREAREAATGETTDDATSA